MSAIPLAITATGMVTAVGYDTASSGYAIRCAIDNFRETRFMDEGGEWYVGAEVDLEEPWRGREKLLQMAARSIRECLAARDADRDDRAAPAVPLILCLPERQRPGRSMDDDQRFHEDLQALAGLGSSPGSRVLTHGHTAAIVALNHARTLLDTGEVRRVIVTGVDSLLSGTALADFATANRLLTSQHSDGFIPGEAAASVLVERAASGIASNLTVHGIGFGMEPAWQGSGQPLRAEGLVTAIRMALGDARLQMHDIDYRLTDATGEQYYFKESSLALTRLLRQRRETFDILHPTDCVGETGAAAGVLLLAYQHFLASGGHSAGKRVLAHFSDNDGKRAAVVLQNSGGQAHG